jgi:hypothetical protein
VRDPDGSAPFGGIGVDVGRVGGEIQVLGALARSPAARAGSPPSDVVTVIVCAGTAGLDIDAVIARLREVALETRRVGVEGSNRIVVVRGLIQPRGVDVNIRVAADGLTAEANGLCRSSTSTSASPFIWLQLPRTSLERRATTGRIQFVRDAEGKIVGAILDPGPDELRGVRID